MDILVILLIAGIIGVLVLFFVETWMLSKFNETYKVWTELVETYIDAFDGAKTAVNTNANTLRSIQETVNEHEKLLKVYAVVLDIHATALHLKVPNLLEEKHTERVVDLEDD